MRVTWLKIPWRRFSQNKFVFQKYILVILFLYLISYPLFWKKDTQKDLQIPINYFETKIDEDGLKKMGYVVNTSQCRIPDIDPWHPSILPYTKFDKTTVIPAADCGKELQWTYVNKSTVVVNETAVQESGYLVSHIYCCYRSILRDPRLVNKATGWYSRVVDSRVVFSAKCIPLQPVTEPDTEYIFVTCKPKNFYWYFDERLLSNVIYKNYHALVLKQKYGEAYNKMKYWQQTKNLIPDSPDNRPPNVILLGIDSTSRLYFRRDMPKTKDILEKLGAQEMFGFTKVGDSTMWNMMAVHLGYTSSELTDACWTTENTKLDLCPFIWKRFSAANYITAEVEDAPRLTHWNYEITGFVEPPTTYYLRPYMLGIYMDGGFYPNRIECVGRRTMVDIFLSYCKDLIEHSQTSRTPFFLASINTQLAHDSSSSLKYGDAPYAEFLEGMVASGFLDNTILFVFGDHGRRYSGLRSTLAGYYEDKLPNLWIRLPPWISKKYPEWKASLIHNSRMVSSGFHLYQTFNHILDTFTNTSEVKGETTTGSIVNRTYGQSFFRPIPKDASCDSSGIPETFCACDLPISLDQSSDVLYKAAQATLKYVNGLLPSQCSKLALLRVHSGAKIEKLKQNDIEYQESKVIVEFSTEPGEFILEGTVIRRKFNSTLEGSEYRIEKDVQRLSKFNTDFSCVKDHQLQLYCYC